MLSAAEAKAASLGIPYCVAVVDAGGHLVAFIRQDAVIPPGGKQQVFGQAQSFVPGVPTNIQFMVKDSKKYAATGGWGVRFLQGLQASRRKVDENLLPLPR